MARGLRRTQAVASYPVSGPSMEQLLAAAVGAVPGGIDRPGQQAMAEAVARAAESGEHLLVQAGTGTGKSLAYLVPALLVDGPVVVSTATLALQSQLVDHDLPRLVDAAEPLLGRRPTFAVLKGRHHYACLARLEGTTEEEPEDALFETGAGGRTKWLGEAGRLGKQIQGLREWALESETGDRDELDPGVDDASWRLASMPARECVGAARCPYGAECFAEASRARAREADIVVTNHSLLAVDMLAGRHIVPPHKLLVVDEAHELADRVSSAAQAEVAAELVERAARRARPFVSPEHYEALIEAGDGLAHGLTTAPPGRIVEGLPAPLREALTLLGPACRRAPPAGGGRFDPLAGALGRPEKDETWQSLDVGSPFDYRRQGILYVAAKLPRPTQSGLSDAAAEELVALVQALGGRTLGLFSSRRAAERAAEVLRAKTDLTVLLQGEEALPLLVRRFRDDQASCLMGVMSLWQGVDVPGDACQLVVIDRLPFPRPDEPLAAARAAAVDAAGGSGFAAGGGPIAAGPPGPGGGGAVPPAKDKGGGARPGSPAGSPPRG